MSSNQLSLFSPKELPTDYKERPPEIIEIPMGIYIIMCDAGYKNRIAASSNIIRTWNKEYKPKESDARCIGPVHAELVAIYEALKRLLLLKKNIKKCIIYSDSSSCFYFLTKKWKPKKKYIEDILEKIIEIVSGINANNAKTFIYNIKSNSIRRIDRRALKKRKEIEKNKEVIIKERLSKINNAIKRSKEIKVYKKGNDYFAMPKIGGFLPGFKVSLFPPLCECPWWRIRWDNKNIATIYKRALPCKHLCALAEFINEDIKLLFQGQINRMD